MNNEERYVSSDELNILWSLIGAYLVFFMQVGFAMLEAGTVRKQNTVSILFKVFPALFLLAHASVSESD